MVKGVANETRKKKERPKAALFGYAVIAFVIGLVVGIAGVTLLNNHNPKDETTAPDVLAASVVFERVVSQNEMACASQTYNIVEKAGSVNTIPFTDIPIPFTQNSFWYRYTGTIKAAVNLAEASYVQEGSRVIITLPQPHISSNTPDMQKSGVLEENNNVLNPIRIEDVDAFTRQCIETSETEVLEGNLMGEARANAEANMRGLFYAAVGDAYQIEFEWQE